MPWLEYDLHLRTYSFENARDSIIDFVGPFISRNRDLFQHWHYLIERDQCREKEGETRIRFESSSSDLIEIRWRLVKELKGYANRLGILMTEDESLGSHEGCHGNRNSTYQGPDSESFGSDWSAIVNIMQSGSEFAINILKSGKSLKKPRSVQYYTRTVRHQYYLHLPANQLLVEP